MSLETLLIILDVTHLALIAPGFLFIVANGRRRLAVRGSVERYRYATICRPLQYFALAWPVVAAADNIASGFAWFIPVNLILEYLIFVGVQEFKRDEDDDFWAGMGKRMKLALKRGLRRAAESLTPVGSPVPVPTS